MKMMVKMSFDVSVHSVTSPTQHGITQRELVQVQHLIIRVQHKEDKRKSIKTEKKRQPSAAAASSQPQVCYDNRLPVLKFD